MPNSIKKFKEIYLFIKNNKKNPIIELFIGIYNELFNENDINNNKFIKEKLLENKYNLNQLYRHY